MVYSDWICKVKEQMNIKVKWSQVLVVHDVTLAT
jgi:hypothetical protein